MDHADGPDAVGASSLWAVGEGLKDTPTRSLPTAQDVARAVLWFSSANAARQVTGQMISVSGGYTMP